MIAASTKPIEAPIAKPIRSSASVTPMCGASRWKSETSALAIMEGGGMMYCGTSSARSRTSAPPTISTATSAIATISAQVRMPPSAEVSADRLVMSTRRSAAAAGWLKVGMVSPSSRSIASLPTRTERALVGHAPSRCGHPRARRASAPARIAGSSTGMTRQSGECVGSRARSTFWLRRRTCLSPPSRRSSRRARRRRDRSSP